MTEVFDADLHLHSLHSIGVSPRMSIPTMGLAAQKKGLHILGTGDATQPDWRKHLQRNLINRSGVLRYEETSFVLTTEFEDENSVHHLVILPDFEAVEDLVGLIRPYSPNVNDKWGGRPRVNMNAESLAGMIRDVGGMIGPAHAFTPFRSIFRQGQNDTLGDCYGTETDNISFLELGLSADTALADHVPELRSLTYVTSSDAHSPSPDKIGREFLRLKIENASFYEISLALRREKGRKPLSNYGLNPRLGKYYLSFCPTCRRTLVMVEKSTFSSYDDINIYIPCGSSDERKKIVENIAKKGLKCPADGAVIRLGVRDRAMVIGEAKSVSPAHRPPYHHIPPLLDVIADALEIKSRSSKKVRSLYAELREQFGDEIEILTQADTDLIAETDAKVSHMIDSFRKDNIQYRAGGGGRYGKLLDPWME
ncbi:MAG: endonuclease Q family protein [Promethearchaeia archaeon]